MLKIAYHPIYAYPLPDGHRFPMVKYDLLPRQLLHEGTCEPDNFFEPGLPDMEDILAAHNPLYVKELQELSIERRAARKIGFPLSELLVELSLIHI